MSDETKKTPVTRQPRRARKKNAAVETRRKTEFYFRGKTMEELLALSHEEQLAIMNSGTRRFFTRQLNYEHEKLWKDINAANEGDSLRTHQRDFPVMPVFVGKTVHVHNGKSFIQVGITSEMIGHKLGEFALTRSQVKHTGPGVGATRSSKFMPLK